MTLDEYFGDWMKVIDRTELNNVMTKIGQKYKRKSIYSAQSDIFRAFELCLLKDLRKSINTKQTKKNGKDLFNKW